MEGTDCCGGGGMKWMVWNDGRGGHGIVQGPYYVEIDDWALSIRIARLLNMDDARRQAQQKRKVKR